MLFVQVSEAMLNNGPNLSAKYAISADVETLTPTISVNRRILYSESIDG